VAGKKEQPMPGYARKDLVREGEVATYHCWSRCVQRSFLYGDDPLTGRNFNYRRGWAEDLLAYQAGVFAVDVGNYSLLSNHAHNILRTRPDIAHTWSPEELALRWKRAWPEFRDGQWVREPTDQELEALLGVPEKLEKIRRNLSSLSWFMARWKEPLAKLCNREMKTSGHFWEARFGCRELLDDPAVTSCSIYVDLNQLRAGLALSLEESQYSAICRRIRAARQRAAAASREEFEGEDPEGLYEFSKSAAEALYADCWLSPITVDGPLLTADSLRVDSPPAGSSRIPVILSRPRSDTPPTPVDGEGVVPAAENRGGNEEAPCLCASDTPALPAAAVKGEVPSSPAKPRRPARRRASDAAIMNIPWPEYLRVVQAVAALTITDPPDSTAASAAREQLEEVLTRWGVNPQAWLVQLAQLERRSTRALGAPQRMVQRAADVAQRWLQGVNFCREIFAEPRSPAARSDEFT
jgi:hypothetical protein